MSKDIMNQELTEMIQTKAKPKPKQEKERLYLHWKFDDDEGQHQDDKIPGIAGEGAGHE